MEDYEEKGMSERIRSFKSDCDPRMVSPLAFTQKLFHMLSINSLISSCNKVVTRHYYYYYEKDRLVPDKNVTFGWANAS